MEQKEETFSNETKKERGKDIRKKRKVFPALRSVWINFVQTGRRTGKRESGLQNTRKMYKAKELLKRDSFSWRIYAQTHT